jgi:hypothetical protein
MKGMKIDSSLRFAPFRMTGSNLFFPKKSGPASFEMKGRAACCRSSDRLPDGGTCRFPQPVFLGCLLLPHDLPQKFKGQHQEQAMVPCCA